MGLDFQKASLLWKMSQPEALKSATYGDAARIFFDPVPKPSDVSGIHIAPFATGDDPFAAQADFVYIDRRGDCGDLEEDDDWKG